MARIPGIADLGPAPTAAPTRPVATIDATPIARGAEQIAQGAQRLGLGVQQAGAGIGELEQDEARWQYAKAHSYLTTSLIDLNSATGKATDYGPDAIGKDLPARYTDQANAYRANAANMIQDPKMRDLFITHTQPALEQGLVQAQAHARALSSDANIAYVSQMGDKTINQAVAAPDDATRAQAIDSHNQLIDGLHASGAISAEQAVQMKQAWAHQYATADVLARADTDPQGVINELRAAPGSPEDIDNRILQIEGRGRNRSSSATGAGQFIDSTWLDLMKRYRPDLAKGRSDAQILALRADEGLGHEMTSHYREENTDALQKQGIAATPGNIYLAHFLGAGGAAAVLKADPNQPVEDVLAKALGPDKAKAMVDANPTVLRGKLAGSVTDWSNGLMGGSSRLVDMLRPDVREQLLARAVQNAQGKRAGDLADFKSRVEDSQAEANRTGNVTAPIPQSDFISRLGADAGPKAFQQYQANIQLGRDVSRVATMDPGEMQQLITSYEPKPGEGYEAQAERQDAVRKAVAHSLKERADDPAGFAVTRLPGTQAAYKSYSAALADPTVDDAQRGVAARSFAATTLLEQQGAGIPLNQRQILPAADVERFKTAWANASTSDDPKARVGLINTIKAQEAMWGSYWPDVVRQLTPSVQPIVRAIAAGADTTAMARLLSLDPKENPKALLKEQSETKAKDLTAALNSEMAPFLSTMVGRQKDRDFYDYYNLADRLSALYARDGKDAATAAHDAFNALIGNRYDFRDTYRIPKDAGVPADDVQAGALAAKNMLTAPGSEGNLLEQARARYPILKNYDYGYVENFRPNAGFLEHWDPGDKGAAPTSENSLDALRPKELPLGKPGLEIRDPNTRPIDILGDIVSHHLIDTDPTVKAAYEKLQASLTPHQQDILKDQYDYAQKNEGETGSFDDWKSRAGMPGFFRGYTFQQWPKEFNDKAYTPEQRADLDKLMGYLSRGGSSGASNPGLVVKPAVDDIGGLSDASGDSVSKFRRDGVWVTSPDNGGLNLMYGDKSVKGADGKPLFLSWGRLAQLGGTEKGRAEALQGALQSAGGAMVP